MENLWGEDKVHPPPCFEDSPPSFNPLADHYFETHGYQASTLFNIDCIFAECSSDGGAFVQCLTERRTASTKAEWIWELLNLLLNFLLFVFFS